MNRRIYGLETEFGIIWTPDAPRKKTLTVQNVVMYLFREIVAGRMYPDVFLENGGAVLPRHRVPPRVRDTGM